MTTPPASPAHSISTFLGRINRELGGDFQLRHFEHQARWNEEQRRIEMHLRSRLNQTVFIPEADLTVFPRRRDYLDRIVSQVPFARAREMAEQRRVRRRSSVGRPGLAVRGKSLGRALSGTRRRLSFATLPIASAATSFSDHLSFRIEPGRTLVLLGRSGSGKTTALKMLNGLLFPTSGEVLVEDRATTDWDLIQLRRSIGYVIQEVGLFPHFTIGENVGLVPRLKGWQPDAYGRE